MRHLYAKLGITLFCIFVFNSELIALELYSIVQQDCNASTGLIINVDSDNIHLLDINGSVRILPSRDVNYILIYNTLDNPIRQLDLKGDLKQYTRYVEVQGKNSYPFIGWPIRFLEDLIVFFDINGNTHLVDIDQIQGFKSADHLATEIKTVPNSRKTHFDFGPNLPGCHQSQSQKAQEIIVQPTRILSDQIGIHKFLSVYRKGFVKLNRFQERTFFYARPYLFEKKSRVGLVVEKEDNKEELGSLFPANFQWPTGSNFGPQGILVLGSSVNQVLPNVEPVFGVSFSGKYHFLSVYFSGNGYAFSSGEKYVIQYRSMFTDFFKKKGPDKTLILPQYNQVALTGFEWGSYSFQGGYYYPLICLQGNGIFRELLSEQSSPMASFSYTTSNLKLQLIGAPIRLKSESPSDDNIAMIYSNEMSEDIAITSASKELVDDLNDFDLNSAYLRLNIDYDLRSDLKFGFSEVIYNGTYEETSSTGKYDLDFREYITSVRAHQEFGDYVSLKGYLNYFMRQFNTKTNNDNDSTSSNGFSFTVVIEFIL